jgi:thiamine biosynthesis lipoprotein
MRDTSTATATAPPAGTAAGLPLGLGLGTRRPAAAAATRGPVVASVPESAPPEAARPGLRHAEHVMGTVFSFDVRDTPTPAIRDALGRCVAWLHRVDRVFSPYRPQSPVSRLARGELGLAACPPEVAEVLARCAAAERVTDGWFSSTFGGRLDPTGLVKGWAVDHASDLLHAAGAGNTCVNGGGDLRTRGEAGPGLPWRIGIADPARPGALTAVVTGTDLAVATSGTAERGTHILDPHTRLPVRTWASVTVVGTRLAETDAYATAAFAMGDAAHAWLDGRPGYAGFTVDADGTMWQTGGPDDLIRVVPRADAA